MKDTGFFVPEEKHNRLATLYRADHTSGEPSVFDGPGGLFSRSPIFESGGGGLVSTVDDYFAFSLMMLGKGEYQDVRVQSRKSVAEMTTNQLTPQQQQGPNAVMLFNNNSGWGLGMAVALRRDQPWLNPGRFG